MKDNLNDLFQERFQGHEAPVDPATWQVIEARLLTAMPPADKVNEMFRERFSGHEANVDPSVWQGISSQLGHGVAAGTGGFGSGWIAAGVAGVLVAGGLIYSLSGEPQRTNNTQPVPQHVEATHEEVAAAQPATAFITTEQVAEPVSNTEQHAGASQAATLGSVPSSIVVGTPDQPSEVGHAGDNTPPDGPLDTSGASVVRQIIALETAAAERALQLSQQRQASSPPPTPANEGQNISGLVNEGPDGEQSPDATQADPKEPCTLFLENIFTPNNDNVNDTYVVKPAPCITSASIRIFSMNGQLVHVMNNYEPWTGANYDEGYYMVAGEARTVDGAMIPVKGFVYLKRGNN